MSLHKLIIAIICGPLFFISSQAQDFDNYINIRSKGPVPEKFTTTSTEKYRKDAGKISETESNRSKRAKDQFYLESNFAVDALLLSGKVLFNDEASVYVNKVLDELLKDDKALRDKIEVYVVRSSAVNAFTTNNGIVFVCMGLLAKLDNEAQLAYVLAHEVIHYREQHVLTGYVENIKIESGIGQYEQQSYNERILARSNFSKDQETEADKEGFKLFQRSKYDFSSIGNVFDVLAFAHIPFSQIDFKKDFLESKDLIFPDFYFLDSVKTVMAADDDDSLGSHPGIKIRREVLNNQLNKKDSIVRQKYIVSKSDFQRIQKISRFEIAGAQLEQREYENALYTAFVLLQENPNSIYLKKIVLNALYGMCKYANARRFDEIHTDYEEIQGSSQQVYYLFQKLTPHQVNIIAINYAWSLRKQYPQDEEIKDLSNDLFTEIAEHHFPDTRAFSKIVPSSSEIKMINTRYSTAIKEEVSTETKTTNVFSEEDDSEEETENKKPKTLVLESNDFGKYAFAIELKDTAFTKVYSQQANVALAKENKKEVVKKRNWGRDKDEVDITGRFALGLNNVVFVSPFYYKYNTLRNDAMQMVDAEQAQRNLSTQLVKSASLAKLNYIMLDKKDLKPEDAEKFNDLIALDNYMNITFGHNKLDFVNNQKDELRAIGKKYNTRYFCWTGVASTDMEEQIKPGVYCLFGCYPLIPYMVYRLIKPKRITIIYTLVLDTETGENVLLNANILKKPDTRDVINSSIYDLCLQLKKKK